MAERGRKRCPRSRRRWRPRTRRRVSGRPGPCWRSWGGRERSWPSPCCSCCSAAGGLPRRASPRSPSRAC
ncbi:hypothetical protein FOF48_02250 [Corallococcus sp. Z5C101001]|nr:hypothetical protein FOF48_02250 [Corallococcus sp. Z5C101001]